MTWILSAERYPRRMIKYWGRRNCLVLALALPLAPPVGWHPVEFSEIPPNQVEFANNGVSFRVADSASGLFFPLARETRITRVHVEGRVQGEWRNLARHPDAGDAILRVGLVEAGSRQLNFVEKWVAPKWLKELFRQIPEDTGVEKVHFFNVAPISGTRDREDTRSEDEFVAGQVVASPEKDGNFEFTRVFSRPMPVVGVWLSADGDDTHSSFTVTVEKAELTSPNE